MELEELVAELEDLEFADTADLRLLRRSCSLVMRGMSCSRTSSRLPVMMEGIRHA